MKKPVTLEAALRKRANEDVSGTITTTFDTDRSGEILRRTRVTKLKDSLVMFLFAALWGMWVSRQVAARESAPV